jgi:hypothetical protein
MAPAAAGVVQGFPWDSKLIHTRQRCRARQPRARLLRAAEQQEAVKTLPDGDDGGDDGDGQLSYV